MLRAMARSGKAWKTHEVGETSWAGTNASTATVPTIYISAISAPAANTARGSVRRGSRTSALIVETSSNPVNANAICDQKLTVSQFHTGKMFAQVNRVTEPWRSHRIPAIAARISNGT